MLSEGVGAGDDPRAVHGGHGCRQYVSPAAALACGAAAALLVISTGCDDQVHERQTSHTALMPHGNQHAATRGEALMCCAASRYTADILNAATKWPWSTVYELIASGTGSRGTWVPTALAVEWLIGTLKGHLHRSCCAFALLEGHSLLLVTAVALFLLLYDCMVFVQARRLKQDRPNSQASLTRASPHPSSGLLAQPAREL